MTASDIMIPTACFPVSPRRMSAYIEELKEAKGKDLKKGKAHERTKKNR
jgi:hypothetical protein